ncbi:hypothetical protein D3C81_2010100 [compost metagenome]
MQPPPVAEALGADDQGGALELHALGQLDQPVGDRLAAVAAVLVGEEGHQVALHGCVS